MYRMSPFLDCYEKGTCYKCKCFLDGNITLDLLCDEDLTHHPDCPLLEGLIVVIQEERGKLSIGYTYK